MQLQPETVSCAVTRRAPPRRCPRGWPSPGRWCNQDNLLGIGLAGDERRAGWPGADPEASLITRVSFTFASSSVSCRLAPCDLADRLAGSRQQTQFLDRAAARNCPESARAPTDPRSRRTSFRSLLRPGTPDVLRVGEHQRERRFVFEDVPRGFQYTPVASIATCVQRPRLFQAGQCEQTRRRGRKLPVLVVTFRRPRCARTRPRAASGIQPGARACKTSMRHLLIAGAGN